MVRVSGGRPAPCQYSDAMSGIKHRACLSKERFFQPGPEEREEDDSGRFRALVEKVLMAVLSEEW